MSNLFSNQVNQQCHFVRLMIKAGRAGQSRHEQRAFVMSAVWHLRRAYLLYLAEIGVWYQCPQPAVFASAAELSQRLLERRKHPAEAKEWAVLESQSQSYVSRFMALAGYFDQVTSEPARPDRVVSRQVSENPLSLVQLPSESDMDVDLDQVQSWLDEFKATLMRQRDMMLEC